MYKFPSIEQFRNVIHHVTSRSRYAGKDETGEPIYDHSRALPILRFRGTVKLHGTNAGIEWDARTGEIRYYSRERVITPESDNAGFARYMSQYEEELKRGFELELSIVNGKQDDVEKIVIYGEWCGGSIQRGVAINGLEKMFVCFAQKVVYTTGEEWEPSEAMDSSFSGVPNFYDIYTFSTHVIDIDFANPGLVQNKLIELTEAVEVECPVGKYFGRLGVGEGIVWTCMDDLGLRFKVKGEKHSSSKVKTLAAVDVEALATVAEFIENSVTENRLEQGLAKLGEMGLPLDIKSMGDFIRWVYNDVVREEADVIEASGIDAKKLGSAVANKARPWFMKALAR